MSYTQTDLDAIEKAIASGRKSVAFADQSVTYQSTDEMLRARNLIKSEIDKQAVPTRVTPRHSTADFSDD